MQLDESKPHSVTWGVGGAQGYEQDGISYDVKKQPITPQIMSVEMGSINVVVDESAPTDYEAAPADYEAMHWKTLKQLVESRGGVWIDKPAALEFLRG